MGCVLPRFIVYGIDRESNEDVTLELDADSAEDAKAQAGYRGADAVSVKPVGDAPPPLPLDLDDGLGTRKKRSGGVPVVLIVVIVSLVALAGLAVLGVSFAVIINQNKRPGPPPPGEAYFYDVVTREYFTDKATLIPPIQSPSGNEAIRAHFFTCGECTEALHTDGGQRFLGYYEKYAPEVKAKIENNPESMHFYEEVFQGRYYCPPGADPTNESNWVEAETPDGFAIAQSLSKKCPARKLRYCPPPR